MPYIKKERRAFLQPGTYDYEGPVDAGELNYTITVLIQDYLGSKKSYAGFNEVVGVLESVKQEYYRRAVAPYEDKKIVENGDVYS